MAALIPFRVYQVSVCMMPEQASARRGRERIYIAGHYHGHGRLARPFARVHGLVRWAKPGDQRYRQIVLAGQVIVRAVAQHDPGVSVCLFMWLFMSV